MRAAAMRVLETDRFEKLTMRLATDLETGAASLYVGWMDTLGDDDSTRATALGRLEFAGFGGRRRGRRAAMTSRL